MRRHRAVLTAVAAALILGAVVPARADTPTEELRRYTDRVLAILRSPSLSARDKRAAVKQVAVEVFDVGETARRALGVHWQARTPDERREFVGLFGDLLERSYISRIELYGGERIQYVGDIVDGDQARVQSKLLTKAGTEIPIEYRMLRRGEQWRVYDVVIEGVSLIASYRTQFNRIIRSSSFEELVRKMRSRQDELGA